MLDVCIRVIFDRIDTRFRRAAVDLRNRRLLTDASRAEAENANVGDEKHLVWETHGP